MTFQPGIPPGAAVLPQPPAARSVESSTGYPRTPNVLRGGLVQVDQLSKLVVGVVIFQYNPDTLTRTLQPRGIGSESGDRLEATRLTGPPHETIKMDVEFDATNSLESPRDQTSIPGVTAGVAPNLAALESMISPTKLQLQQVDALFDQGMLEVAPAEAPLTLLVWSTNRVVPVIISSLSITEEAFDTSLHPIRAKASLELKVLTTNDVPVKDLSGVLYLAYRATTERLAALVTGTNTRPLGFEHLP